MMKSIRKIIINHRDWKRRPGSSKCSIGKINNWYPAGYLLCRRLFEEYLLKTLKISSFDIFLSSIFLKMWYDNNTVVRENRRLAAAGY